MEKFIVSGGNRLYGKTRLKGAKNSILPLLAGALLTREKVTIRDCPDISDVAYMCEIIKSLGAVVVRAGDEITISGGAKNGDVPESLAHEIRSSVFLMGSLVATLGRARIAYPGGCDIGLRPVDIHIRALKELNIKIDEQSGYINCATDGIVGADVGLDKISVGATENIMMAAVLGKGTTIIRNAAKEPEITDLQNMLNKMGAKVRGAGTPVIRIEGVTELHGTEYTPIPDRIVAGTLMTAVGIAGGEIEIENVVPEHIAAITSKLVKSSCKVRAFCDRILISSNLRTKAVDIETSPYPAFPTDMQAQIMAFDAISEGTGIIIENIFETRFKHVPDLRRMGADITVHGDVAVVRGVRKLYGAEVHASDLRGGSALVLAGLKAEGVTSISGVGLIDRGYESFEKTLSSLGAKIQRISVND